MSLLSTRSVSGLQNTRLLCSQRRVRELCQGARASGSWTPDGEAVSPSGPQAALENPGRPTEHLPTPCCFSPSVAGPEDADPVPRARFRGPQLLPLLDEVLNRPPLSRAAAEDEVDASQASVLHLQAAPCALVHDGAILGARGVRGRRDSQRRRQRDGDGKTETETGTERQRDRNKEPERDRDKDGETER